MEFVSCLGLLGFPTFLQDFSTIFGKNSGNPWRNLGQKSKEILEKSKKKKEGSQQHPVFPGGHPSKYWLDSTLLNFSDRTRTGVFNVIWPLASERARSSLFQSLRVLENGEEKFGTCLGSRRTLESRAKKLGYTSSIQCSQAVTHPSTDWTQHCLTSVIGREPVCSMWYGRWHLEGWI